MATDRAKDLQDKLERGRRVDRIRGRLQEEETRAAESLREYLEPSEAEDWHECGEDCLGDILDTLMEAEDKEAH
jgi:hypothetical protein